MKKALGRGLSALIPDHYVKEKSSEEPKRAASARPQTPQEEPEKNQRRLQGFVVLPTEKIRANPEQPRQVFSEESIQELAASIRQRGVLQPIIVAEKKDGYIIVCGERRFRAATACGLKEIPAIIKDVAEKDFLEWGIVENIQREDLNPLEEAAAYQRLLEDHELSQEDVARRVGKNRATIANAVRLLRLPDSVRELIGGGFLSAGHARALLGLLTPEHQRQMAKKIVQENLSVRQVEAMAQRSAAQKRKAKKARNLSPEIVDLEGKLSEFFGTPAKLFPRKDQKQGRLEIQYYSLDDLDRILNKIGIERD